jgi:hypothetical protein
MIPLCSNNLSIGLPILSIGLKVENNQILGPYGPLFDKLLTHKNKMYE